MSLAFERLEVRLLLAATAELKGSTLVIVSTDNAGDDVVVTGNAEGDVDVEINGGGAVNFTGVKSIKVTFGDGDDNLDLFDGVEITGNLTVDLGDGSNRIDIEGDGTDIGGNVKVKGGADDDRFDIDAAGTESLDPGIITIGKNVTVDFGDASAGADRFDALGDSAGEEVHIGGSLSVKGRAGLTHVFLDATEVAKNLKLDTGAGDDDIRLQTRAAAAGVETTVLKSASIKTGDGDDQVLALGNAFAGTFDVDKNLTIDLGNAAAGGDTLDVGALLAADVFHVGGNVSIKGKAGAQDLDLDGFDFDKNVKVSLGDGDDTIDINQGGGLLAATVGGSVNINLGDGDDTLLAEDLAITKNAKLVGGAGDDEATDTDPVSITVGGTLSGDVIETTNLL